MILRTKERGIALVIAALSLLSGGALAQAPSAASTQTLVANQDIAKAQAVSAISTFMTQGSSVCDSEGKNCRSVFGADGTPDYTTLQDNSSGVLGISSMNFGNPGDDSGSGSSVAVQTGTFALACGNTAAKVVAGVAVKLNKCQVNTNGDALVEFKVCTAPSRGLSVSPQSNTVPCSSDPKDANFRPPAGFTCAKPTCDTEPDGTLNGWSDLQTVQFKANMPSSSTEDEKSKNGLGLVFYPDLSGGVIRDFKADSDNMTAVKVIQTAYNSETGKTAVAFKVAYRKKTTVTKDMVATGAAAIPNPSGQSSMWDIMLKLQGDARLPQYASQYAQKGSSCMQQVNNGLATDGKITVCDETYENESGIKPLAHTAQLAAENQQCSTTKQCLEKVTNTNTWTETCRADVPLAIQNCTTTTDYTMNTQVTTRHRTTDVCHEARTKMKYSCTTQAILVGAAPKSCPAGTVLADQWGPNACSNCTDNRQHFKVTCLASNQVNVRWYTVWAGTNTEAYRITDRTITVNPFESNTQYLGPFCQDGSGTVPFQTTCNGLQCQYRTWITGNCNGAKFGLSATALVDVSFDGIYSIVNNCSTYENAK